MSVIRFLELARSNGLLDPATVQRLQDQLREKPGSLSAEQLARQLVDSGRLTRFQAGTLLDSLSTENPAVLELLSADQAADVSLVLLEPLPDETDSQNRGVSADTSAEQLPPNRTSPAPRGDSNMPVTTGAAPPISGETKSEAPSATQVGRSRQVLHQGVAKEKKGRTGNPTDVPGTTGEVASMAPQTQRWDSRLILLGGGTLLVLLLSAALLIV
ncbi:MAG TPA: hypothetical protein VIY86_11795, partial [Pirellulaceae bacterium]